MLSFPRDNVCKHRYRKILIQTKNEDRCNVTIAKHSRSDLLGKNSSKRFANFLADKNFIEREILYCEKGSKHSFSFSLLFDNVS